MFPLKVFGIYLICHSSISAQEVLSGQDISAEKSCSHFQFVGPISELGWEVQIGHICFLLFCPKPPSTYWQSKPDH